MKQQKVNRKGLQAVTEIVEKSGQDLFVQICKLSIFRTFLKRAPKARVPAREWVYQFVYAAIKLRQIVLSKCSEFKECKELDDMRSICKAKKHEKRIAIHKDWFEDMLD